MGWTVMDRPKEGRKAFFDGQFKEGSLVASRLVGSTYYAAVRMPSSRVEGADYVIGLVILTQLYGHEMSYKDICESSLPRESSCPASVLNQLSPIAHLREVTDHAESSLENMAKWRQACREHLAYRPPAIGDRIRFSDPLKFSGGLAADTFERVAGKRGTYRDVASGELVALPPRLVRQAQRLEGADRG